jgi:DNA-binding PadR family transcriptional regulator
MRSPVNWALLGLVIERPGYAYELAQRFQHVYQDALTLSSTSHVYTALTTLTDRALVEELPGSREGRQPRPRYTATANGLEAYEEWLIGQVSEERRRQRLAVLQLAALKRRPDAQRMLTRYEQALATDSPDGRASNDCIAALLCEERRLSTVAKLAWVAFAREQLQRFPS